MPSGGNLLQKLFGISTPVVETASVSPELEAIEDYLDDFHYIHMRKDALHLKRVDPDTFNSDASQTIQNSPEHESFMTICGSFNDKHPDMRIKTLYDETRAHTVMYVMYRKYREAHS